MSIESEDNKLALLVVAHGSRVEQSNQEVIDLAKDVSRHTKSFSFVSHAFLEIAEPNIPKGIESCIKSGSGKILVLPYFLSAGRHVTEDIPNIIDEFQTKYPKVTIKLLPYFGQHEQVATILGDIAEFNI